MDVQREDMRAGLQRANGVLNWRGVPENHPAREHAHQFRAIIADLERCFGDASHEQIDAQHGAHDCVTRLMPELLRKHSEDELVAREADILTALLDMANRHLVVWSALRTKIEGIHVSLTERQNVDPLEQRCHETSANEV